jgi:hypothetical protein
MCWASRFGHDVTKRHCALLLASQLTFISISDSSRGISLSFLAKLRADTFQGEAKANEPCLPAATTSDPTSFRSKRSEQSESYFSLVSCTSPETLENITGRAKHGNGLVVLK